MSAFPTNTDTTFVVAEAISSTVNIAGLITRPSVLDTHALTSTQETFNLDAGASIGDGFQTIKLALSPFILSAGILLYESAAAEIDSTSVLASPGDSSLQFVKVAAGVDLADVLDVATGGTVSGVVEGTTFWSLGAAFEVIAGANSPTLLNFASLSQEVRTFKTGDRLAVLRVDFPDISVIGFGNAVLTVALDYNPI